MIETILLYLLIRGICWEFISENSHEVVIGLLNIVMLGSCAGWMEFMLRILFASYGDVL